MSIQNDYVIRKAVDSDLDEIKKIADSHKKELGFIRRPALARSIAQEELIVAANGVGIMGFIQYHHRRDEQTTLHNIVVVQSFRKIGVGQKLIQRLEAEAIAMDQNTILLKCPEDLDANEFYKSIGYSETNKETGKARSLIIWTKVLKS
ncbi:MAG: GNAT family N-acetyltransferase [Anaerolineales bacterium]|nr:GNAT family N-acetyltransferase [Anaerolineales bacterium]